MDILAAIKREKRNTPYQHEQLSSQGKSKQNANVSRYGQLSIFISFMMVLTEEVKQFNSFL
jgi:hypothetical protein